MAAVLPVSCGWLAMHLRTTCTEIMTKSEAITASAEAGGNSQGSWYAQTSVFVCRLLKFFELPLYGVCNVTSRLSVLCKYDSNECLKDLKIKLCPCLMVPRWRTKCCWDEMPSVRAPLRMRYNTMANRQVQGLNYL